MLADCWLGGSQVSGRQTYLAMHYMLDFNLMGDA